MDKTNYMRMWEEQLGMPLEEFVLDYLNRGESRSRVAQRTGIPMQTLRNWESRLVKVEQTFRLREPVG